MNNDRVVMGSDGLGAFAWRAGRRVTLTGYQAAPVAINRVGTAVGYVKDDNSHPQAAKWIDAVRRRCVRVVSAVGSQTLDIDKVAADRRDADELSEG